MTDSTASPEGDSVWTTMSDAAKESVAAATKMYSDLRIGVCPLVPVFPARTIQMANSRFQNGLQKDGDV